ncbi:MAG: hypothetical protein M1272_04675 [Firmicutes bacterium]|nr:hypothetical protein [Bacillota bacterium]
MADTNNPKQSIRQLTREKFQEEVARELGIDLNGATLPNRDIQKLENDLHANGEEATEPS